MAVETHSPNSWYSGLFSSFSGVNQGGPKVSAIAVSIAFRLKAIASKLEAMASRLETIPIRLKAMASRLETIAIRLKAIASRLETIAVI